MAIWMGAADEKDAAADETDEVAGAGRPQRRRELRVKIGGVDPGIKGLFDQACDRILPEATHDLPPALVAKGHRA